MKSQVKREKFATNLCDNLCAFRLALIALFFGVCAAQSYRAERDANEIVITRSESENDGAGNFRWASELSDGTKLEQEGELRAGPDPENSIQVIRGSYSYTAPDGQVINLKYVADENGFQPEGEHLPTPPPIPEAIQKALDIIYRNAENQAGQPAAPSQPARNPAPSRQQPRRGWEKYKTR